MAAAALDSVSLLWHQASARRVPDDRVSLVSLSAQAIVRAIQAAAVQSLVRMLARVRVLLCLIQDIL